MPWSSPAKRMKEMVNAIKAIWSCWHEGKDLDLGVEIGKNDSDTTGTEKYVDTTYATFSLGLSF